VAGFSAHAMVGANGRLHCPRLLIPPAATVGDLAYLGLEAMRQFRFSPARFEGEPVECPFGVEFATRTRPTGPRQRLRRF
jgi:hypothetical protein